ncbi:MAG TPA: lipid-binding SYLF domain-containing protein [Geminicoccaceae bacterium]|nr:lipid-binding SYLF domain-containing protein [Geminicoccus sp.]HMU52360.1 lipid-binding SYLF domain-containing protein [Geminicoccaceae bacterium]
MRKAVQGTVVPVAVALGLLLAAPLTMAPVEPALAATAAELETRSKAALDDLLARNQVARLLADSAVGILVFPEVVKGGFIVGGQFGDGALIEHGSVAGYYRTIAASYGLQAGAQSFGYALFFMNRAALDYLGRSNGWEVGVGPTLVVMDEGRSASLSTTTAKDDIYAFFFDQKGLMAGIGIQGSKISRIDPDG